MKFVDDVDMRHAVVDGRKTILVVTDHMQPNPQAATGPRIYRCKDLLGSPQEIEKYEGGLGDKCKLCDCIPIFVNQGDFSTKDIVAYFRDYGVELTLGTVSSYVSNLRNYGTCTPPTLRIASYQTVSPVPPPRP